MTPNTQLAEEGSQEWLDATRDVHGQRAVFEAIKRALDRQQAEHEAERTVALDLDKLDLLILLAQEAARKCYKTGYKEVMESAITHALEKLAAQYEAELERYKRISESGESLGGELEERERRMELEAERDAAVADAQKWRDRGKQPHDVDEFYCDDGDTRVMMIVYRAEEEALDVEEGYSRKIYE